MSSFGGNPLNSIINCNCSASDSPGNKGCPEKSSTKIHPSDHISIAGEYGMPKIISGDR